MFLQLSYTDIKTLKLMVRFLPPYQISGTMRCSSRVGGMRNASSPC